MPSIHVFLKRLAVLSFVGCLAWVPSLAYTQDIQTDALVSAPRVAPGESMPVRVRLSNLGSSGRVDAVIIYRVVDSDGNTVARDTETAAVDTTASFVHPFLLPRSVRAGSYVMQVVVAYPGRQALATASYNFTVERKIFGMFQSDLTLYIIIAIMGMLLVWGMVLISEKYHHRTAASREYSHIPNAERIYYEIVADAIRQMRLHEGDKALVVAAQSPGLTIDARSGAVMNISGDPASVVAGLVGEYERAFGTRINFSLGKKVPVRAIIKQKP